MEREPAADAEVADNVIGAITAFWNEFGDVLRRPWRRFGGCGVSGMQAEDAARPGYGDAELLTG